MNTHDTISEISDFIQQKQREANAAFSTLGFPTKKHEDWKYVSFKAISSLLEENQENEPHFIDISLIQEILQEKQTKQNIVFLNGNFSSDLSTKNIQSCSIHSFHKSANIVDFQRLYNTSIDNGNGFCLYNTASVSEGLYMEIESNFVSKEPIFIYFFHHNSSVVQPRILLTLGKNSQVSCVETHINLSNKLVLENAVMECFVGENAQLSWTKIQNDTNNSVLIDSTFITQSKNSTAKVSTISTGNKQIRNSLHFFQKGTNCNSILNGISILDKEQEVDNHTVVHHFELNCESHELYRGIYNDFSHGIFNGKVLVEKEAQKLNAYQQNNSILLSENASIDAKPQLEIFADDVKCSHGCTIGQFDDDALFYLQTRGIPKAEAQALLTIAFVNEVLEQIDNEELQSEISEIISKKLNLQFDL